MTTLVTTLAGARSPDNRAAILARKGPLAQHDSTARQLADAQGLAQENGWSVQPQHVFIARNAVGTAPLAERDDLTPLAAAVVSGEIKHVVVSDLGRLTRDLTLLTRVLEILGHFGVTLWCSSTSTSFDLSTAEGLKTAVSAAHGGRVCNGKEA